VRKKLSKKNASRARARVRRRPNTPDVERMDGRHFNIEIDKEFANLVPPLSDVERAELEQSILADGCRDALVVWRHKKKCILIDGHNRYGICRKHGIPFAVIVKEFSTRNYALAWIASNQLRRRNVTPEAVSYLRGVQYNLQKNQGVRDSGAGQSGQKLTATVVAEQHAVGSRTVRRDARFAAALDDLCLRHGPDLKKLVLLREVPIRRATVHRLVRLEANDAARAIERIRSGEGPAEALRDVLKKPTDVAPKLPDTPHTATHERADPGGAALDLKAVLALVHAAAARTDPYTVRDDDLICIEAIGSALLNTVAQLRDRKRAPPAALLAFDACGRVIATLTVVPLEPPVRVRLALLASREVVLRARIQEVQAGRAPIDDSAIDRGNEQVPRLVARLEQALRAHNACAAPRVVAGELLRFLREVENVVEHVYGQIATTSAPARRAMDTLAEAMAGVGDTIDERELFPAFVVDDARVHATMPAIGEAVLALDGAIQREDWSALKQTMSRADRAAPVDEAARTRAELARQRAQEAFWLHMHGPTPRRVSRGSTPPTLTGASAGGGASAHLPAAPTELVPEAAPATAPRNNGADLGAILRQIPAEEQLGAINWAKGYGERLLSGATAEDLIKELNAKNPKFPPRQVIRPYVIACIQAMSALMVAAADDRVAVPTAPLPPVRGLGSA
jgi:hypothetical protein